MKYFWLAAVLSCIFTSAMAQRAREGTHLVPTGKGWGQVAPAMQPPRIWGDSSKDDADKRDLLPWWADNGGQGEPVLYLVREFPDRAASDSVITQELLTALFSTGGLGGTAYARINSTYSDRSHAVSGNFALLESANDYYSRGTQLNDAAVTAVVAQAIRNPRCPRIRTGCISCSPRRT